MAHRSIEIITPQNVILNFELATPWLRTWALFLDYILLIVVSAILYMIFMNGLGLTNLNIAILFIWLSYDLLFEWLLKGVTPGKLICGIFVVKTNGTQPEFYDIFLRCAMRPFEILMCFGLIAFFVSYGTEKNQRIGDILASTIVLRKRSSLHFTLSDIMRLHHNRKQTEITYPKLRYIEEEHILLIKNLINSRADYSSKAYSAIVQEATEKMAKLLALDSIPENRLEFLGKCVEEYIIITR